MTASAAAGTVLFGSRLTFCARLQPVPRGSHTCPASTLRAQIQCSATGPRACSLVMMCPSTKKPSAKGTGKHPHRVRKLQAEALTLQEQLKAQQVARAKLRARIEALSGELVGWRARIGRVRGQWEDMQALNAQLRADNAALNAAIHQQKQQQQQQQQQQVQAQERYKKATEATYSPPAAGSGDATACFILAPGSCSPAAAPGAASTCSMVMPASPLPACPPLASIGTSMCGSGCFPAAPPTHWPSLAAGPAFSAQGSTWPLNPAAMPAAGHMEQPQVSLTHPSLFQQQPAAPQASGCWAGYSNMDRVVSSKTPVLGDLPPLLCVAPWEMASQQAPAAAAAAVGGMFTGPAMESMLEPWGTPAAVPPGTGLPPARVPGAAPAAAAAAGMRSPSMHSKEQQQFALGDTLKMDASLDALLADDTCWGSESLEDLLQELGGSDADTAAFHPHISTPGGTSGHLLVTPVAPAMAAVSPLGRSSSHSSDSSCGGSFHGSGLEIPVGLIHQQQGLCRGDARVGMRTPDLRLPAPAFAW